MLIKNLEAKKRIRYNGTMATNEVKAFLDANPEVADRLGKKNPTLIDVLNLVSEMKKEQQIKAEPLKMLSGQIPASLYDRLDEVINEIKQMGGKVKKREIIANALDDYLQKFTAEEIIYNSHRNY